MTGVSARGARSTTGPRSPESMPVETSTARSGFASGSASWSATTTSAIAFERRCRGRGGGASRSSAPLDASFPRPFTSPARLDTRASERPASGLMVAAQGDGSTTTDFARVARGFALPVVDRLRGARTGSVPGTSPGAATVSSGREPTSVNVSSADNLVPPGFSLRSGIGGHHPRRGVGDARSGATWAVAWHLTDGRTRAPVTRSGRPRRRPGWRSIRRSRQRRMSSRERSLGAWPGRGWGGKVGTLASGNTDSLPLSPPARQRSEPVNSPLERFVIHRVTLP